MAKFFKIIAAVAVVAFLAAAFFIWRNIQLQSGQIGQVKITPVPESQNNNQPTQNKIKSLPIEVSINVPFASQAPFEVWDAYHEEACEEASLIMVKYFLDKKSLMPAVAEDQIQKMIAFEIKNYGDYKDTNAQQNVQLAADFYGINNLKVIYDFQKEDLKKYLAQGLPVIIPAAGRMLDNPNFKSPGPLYHNLVLTGYDGDTIITNDPGTKRGQGYRYNIDVLYNAIHDFPGNVDNIIQGRKAMIVLE